MLAVSSGDKYHVSPKKSCYLKEVHDGCSAGATSGIYGTCEAYTLYFS